MNRRLLPLPFFILIGLCLSLAPGLRAAPASGPSALPPTAAPSTRPAATTQPSAREAAKSERDTRRKLVELTRKSIQLVEAKKFDQTEKVLEEALALVPDDPTTLYNFACLRAIQGRGDDAMIFLVKSAGAGFTDFHHIEKDSDLDSLRGRQDYKVFIGHREDFQRKAARAALDMLRKEFGPDYLYEIDNESKLIFATKTDPQTLAALKKSLTSQAHSQWQMLFEHKPEDFIIVVVPSAAKFREIVKVPYVEGFYNNQIHTLIAKGLGFVTTHEFTHALHAADAEFVGQEHPIWLVEGLAVLFEHSEWQANPDDTEHPEDKLLVPLPSFRLQLLKNLVASNRLVPFARMLTMDQEAFVRQAMATYAEAGNLMAYLYDHKLLRKFYDTYKAGYEKDKTGRLALEEVTGMKLSELEEDFKKWVRVQTPPSTRTGPNGPFLGLRFTSANDGIRVDSVVPGEPAAKAGLKNGDVVVGLNDVDVRDMPTFLPMLAGHKPGEKITLKVRRDKQYLDVAVVLGKRSEAGQVRELIEPAGKPAKP